MAVKRKHIFTEGAFVSREVKHTRRTVIDTTTEYSHYRMDPTDCETVKGQINEWLVNGEIEAWVTFSPWSIDVVLVRNTDKKAISCY